METIGGTGETITGIVTALIGAGIEAGEVAVLAELVNRLSGYYSKNTPPTLGMDIIKQIPAALARIAWYRIILFIHFIISI